MTDQATAPTEPVAEEVGRLYDRLTNLATAFMGDEAQQGYNVHLGYWDSPESDLSFDEATDRLTDIMTDRLRIGAGSRLLDVGCGVGAPALRIARRTGARVTGISVSREQVDRAEALARATGLQDRLAFEQVDAMELPYADASFDAVLALESMFHMPDRVRVLREMRRVLRPGGRVVLTDFCRRGSFSPDQQAVQDAMGHGFHSTTVEVDDYPPMFRGAGLRLTELLDITDETLSRSFAVLAERAERLRAEFGDAVDGGFDPRAVADVPELGYFLVCAQRPDGD